MSPTRREFLGRAATAIGAAALGASASACSATAPAKSPTPAPALSLAEWSLHRTIRAGDLDPLDFAPYARDVFGLDAVEHVNQFFIDRARDAGYLAGMRRRADDAGVRSLLIMCDLEGALGDPRPTARLSAVDAHRKWLDAASALGCHSIRVNAESAGTRDEQMRLCAEGLHRLCDFAEPHGLDVLVENHGGLSSDGGWLAGLIRATDHPRAGTLPDFGNFEVSPGVWYDRYRGVEELMPWARAVSAKSYDFDANGDETTIDYGRMMRIVTDAGYDGAVGVEYEGNQLGEDDGIRTTMRLLLRTQK